MNLGSKDTGVYLRPSRGLRSLESQAGNNIWVYTR